MSVVVGAGPVSVAVTVAPEAIARAALVEPGVEPVYV